MQALRGKRLFALLLALTMMLALAGVSGVAAWADEISDITMEPSDTDRQLSLIQSQVPGLLQPAGDVAWYYTVTDLDHNGSLEFVAASQHPQNRATNLRVWEVNAERTGLTECGLVKDPEESFPDILTDAADTYHSASTDTWYYLLYDNVVLSDTEVYTVKTAVRLQNGALDYDAYAVEHTEVANSLRSVSHTDASGIAISQEQYNASGSDALAGTQRSSTNFEWLTADEANDLAKLTDCFSVFMGQKAPTERFPVPRPAALDPNPAATPAPLNPAPTPVYLSVTKNPTNENRTEGDTAYFVAAASAYESLSWTFVSPDGGQYSAQAMQNTWGGIGGMDSTTLSISGVTTGMNNWGVFCTFYYRGQTARTATAYLYVSAKPQPRPYPPSGSYDGSVTDYSYSTVTVYVQDLASVTLGRSFCDIDGDLYVGAPATVLWDGQNVVGCYITGSQPVGPIYGSMSGTAHEGGGGFAVDLSNGDEVYVDGWKCNVTGTFYDGAPCVVYYENYPSSDNIYSADIYGSDDPPVGPIIGVMDCPNCGTRLPINTQVCPNCGYVFYGDPDTPDPDFGDQDDWSGYSFDDDWTFEDQGDWVAADPGDDASLFQTEFDG